MSDPVVLGRLSARCAALATELHRLRTAVRPDPAQLEQVIRTVMLRHGVVHEGLVADLARSLADSVLTCNTVPNE